MLLPGHAARKLIDHPSTPYWATIAERCRCGDVPLACALADIGMPRIRHLPATFLDSCLYCADFLKPRRIISCHAASVFRGYNRYATDKRDQDRKPVNGTFAFRLGAHNGKRPYKYGWPNASKGLLARGDDLLIKLVGTPLIDRMYAVERVLCPPSLEPPVGQHSYCSPTHVPPRCSSVAASTRAFTLQLQQMTTASNRSIDSGYIRTIAA